MTFCFPSSTKAAACHPADDLKQDYLGRSRFDFITREFTPKEPSGWFSFKFLLILGVLLQFCEDRLITVPLSSSYYQESGVSPVNSNVTLNSEVAGQSQQYTYKSSIYLRVYGMLSKSPTTSANTLKLFDFNGKLLASANTIVNEKPILHLKDPLKILYSNDLADFRRLGLTLLNGLGVLTQEEVKNLVYGARCSVVEETTDYVYVASIPPGVQLYRPQLNCLSCTLLSFKLSPAVGWTPAVVSIRTDTPQGLLVFANSATAVQFNMNTLSEIGRASLSLTQDAVGANFGILDNLKPDFYFYLDSAGTISGFKIPPIGSNWALEARSGLQVGSVSNTPGVISASDGGGYLMNFGTYNLLGMTDPAADNLWIFFKNTLSSHPDSLSLKYVGGYKPTRFGAVGTICELGVCHFAIQARGSLTFQSYYLILDVCATRDVSGQCLMCMEGYYLTNSTIDNLCLPWVLIETGKGANTDSGTIATCIDSGCIDCRQNNKICKHCDPQRKYFLNANTSSCFLQDEIRPGFGANLTSGQINECIYKNCICNSDNTLCQGCRYDLGFYLSSNSGCMPIETAPPGTGINITSTVLEPCAIPYCLACLMNIKKCTVCDTKNYYALENETCVLRNAKLELDYLSFDRRSQSASFTFRYPLKKILNSDLAIEVRSKLDGQVYICDKVSCQVNNTAKGFSIVFNFDSTFQADLVISNTTALSIQDASTPNRYYQSYPIRLSGISILANGANAQKAADTTAATINAIRAASSLMSMASSPATAIALDRVVSEFTYLQLLGGPQLTFPSLILEATLGMNLLPIDFGNPFEEWTAKDEAGNSNPEDSQTGPPAVTSRRLQETIGLQQQNQPCQLPEVYVNSGIYCNFLRNYGQDFSVIMYTLGITIVISLVIRVVFFYLDRKCKIASGEIQPEPPALKKMDNFERMQYEFEQEEAKAQQEQNNSARSAENPSPRTVKGTHRHSLPPVVLAAIMKNIKRAYRFSFVSVDNTRQVLRAVKTEYPQTFKTLEYIRDNYGVRFFLIKMEGVQLQIMCFILVHFGSMWSSTAMFWGMFASLCGLIYYITIAASLYFISRRIFTVVSRLKGKEISEDEVEGSVKLSPKSQSPRRKSFHLDLKSIGGDLSEINPMGEDNQANNSQRDQKGPKDQKPKEKLDDVIDYSKIPSGLMLSFYFEDYLSPTSAFQLYFPMLNTIRSILVAVLLFLFSKTPTLQLTLALGIESCLLYHIVHCKIKASRVERLLDATCRVLTILYILCKMLALTSLSEVFKQNYLGFSMAIFLIIIVLLNFVLVIFSIIMLLWSLLMLLLKFLRDRAVEIKNKLKEKFLGPEVEKPAEPKPEFNRSDSPKTSVLKSPKRKPVDQTDLGFTVEQFVSIEEEIVIRRQNIGRKLGKPINLITKQSIGQSRVSTNKVYPLPTSTNNSFLNSKETTYASAVRVNRPGDDSKNMLSEEIVTVKAPARPNRRPPNVYVPPLNLAKKEAFHESQ